MDPMDRESLTAPPPGSILVIERVFDAPRERVWMAWTDPDLVKRWWGPKGFTAPVCRISLRVGGSYFLCMRSPQGKDYCNAGFYREIVPLERIVVTASFADEKGNVVSATSYGMGPGWAREMLQTVTFEERGGKHEADPEPCRHSGRRRHEQRPGGLEPIVRQARRSARRREMRPPHGRNQPEN